MKAAGWSRAAFVAVALTALSAQGAETRASGVRYYVKATTAKVTISLPAGDAQGEDLYRDASGKWLPLPGAERVDGKLTFTLSAEQMGGGGTVLLLDKPKWLDADDDAPPRATSVLVDGKSRPCGKETDLGWIDQAPRSFEVHVVDDRNPLDPGSVCARVNGVRRQPDGKVLRFEADPADKKKGRIICSLPELVGSDPAGTVRLLVECDDFAADEAKCTALLSFTITRPPQLKLGKPAAVAPNGIKVFVDSTFGGYENVECLVDGELQPVGTTTCGKTWASAENPNHHWVCFVTPAPRQVSGLAISWAHYQKTFWTSSRYDIMTWDGKQWSRALRVQNNPEAQTSRHEFPARTTDRVLVLAPEGGNHPGRPDLMWMTEVAFLP